MRDPRTQTILFGTVCFKHYHFRYPKTRFLAHGVQRYGCLGRHPRTHTIFSGIVQFKDTHPGDPKTLFLAHGAEWFWWLGRHPRTLECGFRIGVPTPGMDGEMDTGVGVGLGVDTGVGLGPDN